ncbi:MAG: type II secretion system minor pseudopilin GspK [Ottowia sp.]|uniref:Type II secretion system protein K n=2 Tax=Ottowia beijingensis TaxID=1207057 RepID=A0A853IR37_9BURK|nr:type II secretion system minor pseudopilin GspK [Ottowia sp.]MBP7530950.1 type II secretion system minor pseudopilin GspK [Ottowia sp.]MBP7536830.1 type II secretion system minor pseudopilin GspK [Ottowia sp.]MBP9953940.1 type II secretion system minor pseudopilin GspK [Ottowia sp.]NZA01335.1 type II secretion system minor pseudopilin GspK [Ottowia beijingensis]
MITVTLVATLAAAALWRQWRGVEVEAAERARVQSAWLLTGALDWSRLILSGDYSEDERKRQMVDHLGEPWAVPLAEARLSTFLAAGESSSDTHRDAFLSGEVTDLQSRLNVMNLAVGDANGRQEAYLRFQRLFELLNLRNAELALLRDNLQRAADAMKAAAPDGNDAPLLPRRFDQLAWLGLSPESLQVLRPYLTVLPLEGSAATKVNVNTAPAPVLVAALGLNPADAQRLVGERERDFFKDLADARLQRADTAWAGVNSSFFEVRGRLRLDDVALEEVSVVRRTGRNRVSTLWRERAALSVPVAR